jgi:hypothetical protein
VTERIRYELSDRLTVIDGDFPETLDAPNGAVVMLQLRHSGQITLSRWDWELLQLFCQGGKLKDWGPQEVRVNNEDV